MASPQEYDNKITALGLDNRKFNASSLPEAERVLSLVRDFQNSLWELKRGVKADVSAVWDSYRDQSKDTIGDSIAAAFLGKQRAYRIRKHTRDQLAHNRDQLLAGYREAESRIDDFLKQLDDARSQVHKFINELKAEERNKQRSGFHAVLSKPIPLLFMKNTSSHENGGKKQRKQKPVLATVAKFAIVLAPKCNWTLTTARMTV